jgi:DNA-binding NarL/FixJ family response regulator
MRVVLAEDLALLRDGIVRILTAHDIEVVQAVDNGPSLLKAITEHRPDIAVVDVRLPPGFTDEGLRAALAARERIPGLPVLVVSQYVEQLYARELLSQGTGGVGYLLKDRISDVAQFIDAVHRVAGGGTAMDSEVIAALLSRHRDSTPVAALTPREHEVLTHMAQGRSNAAIAAAMFITEKAVGKHTNAIFGKLGLEQSEDDNRRVLAVLAYLESAPRPRSNPQPPVEDEGCEAGRAGMPDCPP